VSSRRQSATQVRQRESRPDSIASRLPSHGFVGIAGTALVLAASLIVFKEDPRVPVGDQNLIVVASNLVVGEERKLDGSVTLILKFSPLISERTKIKQPRRNEDQRDDVIRGLLQRVKRLERELSTPGSGERSPAHAAASEATEAMPIRRPPPQGAPQAFLEPPNGQILVSDEANLYATAPARLQIGSNHPLADEFELAPRSWQPDQIALAADMTLKARKSLSDAQLDSVTAGTASMHIELFAAAEGPAAVTSTQGSIATAQSNVLRIAVDPSAPEPARARLLGVSTADLIFANGKADAAGASAPQCLATPTAVGDAAYVAQSRTATAISATCACAGFAIGIVLR
jgi:hypothetical protein